MPTHDITAAVVSMNAHETNELLTLLAAQEITITCPPRTGLLMMTVTDSFGADFHLGEVLITEAQVSVAGKTGYGMVTGEEPRKALARAAADALLQAARPADLCRQVTECLEQALHRQATLHAQDAAVGASTKVSFDLMPKA